MEATSFPDPKTFFDEHIKGRKPVLFKGILEKGILPAYKLWTDEYLRENFGKDSVMVELGKKENRDEGGDSFTFTQFLDKYRKENIYMVNDISEDMARDVNLPPSMVCGGMQRAIQNVILWFSSGGTKSVLHNDGLDNINCLLDGEKYLVMIDKKHSKLIETEHWKTNGAYHRVDVEKVDMIKYPQFQDIAWYEVKMKKGDCLFIPFKWYHHVDSSAKGRNMALNFWFNHMMIFNDTDCKDVDTEKPLPLAGIRKKTKDVESIRGELMGVFDDENPVGFEQFTTTLEGTEIVDKETVKEFFRYIDMDGDQKVTPEEMQTFDIKKAVDELPALKKALHEYLEAAEEDDEEDDGEDDMNGEDPENQEMEGEEDIDAESSTRDEL
ncbi:hypothetical protein FSP39_005376 [Pinctada imbricata]|uniref:JmjC domain-containing protein n=1 Tax=Pinctada imbricata TaxID=66713 RepID=A0AA88Y971_PINIB|nr:hypothetical protein FSP39_005376 [Pinctada imbricata]